jgi:hypothetical protein
VPGAVVMIDRLSGQKVRILRAAKHLGVLGLGYRW